MTGKNAVTTRGRPFAAGNAGRPKGARHKATLAAEALLEGEAERLSRKAVELALAGDTTALRLCLERLSPPRRERLILWKMPAVITPQDHPIALSAVIAAVASGDLATSEGEAFARLLGEHRKALETADLAARLAALEAKVEQDVADESCRT